MAIRQVLARTRRRQSSAGAVAMEFGQVPAQTRWIDHRAHVARDRENGGRGGVVGAPGIGGEGWRVEGGEVTCVWCAKMEVGVARDRGGDCGGLGEGRCGVRVVGGKGEAMYHCIFFV